MRAARAIAAAGTPRSSPPSITAVAASLAGSKLAKRSKKVTASGFKPYLVLSAALILPQLMPHAAKFNDKAAAISASEPYIASQAKNVLYANAAGIGSEPRSASS